MPNSTCRWPDCENESRSRGLCPRDYARAKRAGDFESPWVGKEMRVYGTNAGQECRWPGCSESAAYSGLCRRDYSRAKRLGNKVDPWNDWATSGTCEVCAKPWKSERNANLRFCSNSCRSAQYRIDNPELSAIHRRDSVRRYRARKFETQVDSFTTHDVRMMHGDICYLCSKKIDFSLKLPNPKSPSLDHVIALSRGGTHTLENVAMTHLDCNVRKHAAPTTRRPQPTMFAL